MPAIRGSKSKSKVRRYTRAIDQVHADVKDPAHLAQYTDTKAVEDLPGLGAHYCVECAKWFEAENNLLQHRKGKPHKKRLRVLREEPHTQKEAEAAIGLRTDNGRPAVAIVLETAMAVDTPSQSALAEGLTQAQTQVQADMNDDVEYDAFFTAY